MHIFRKETLFSEATAGDAGWGETRGVRSSHNHDAAEVIESLEAYGLTNDSKPLNLRVMRSGITERARPRCWERGANRSQAVGADDAEVGSGDGDGK